jgi:hypothetical protein
MRTMLPAVATALSLVALTPAPANAVTCYTSTSGASTWYSGASASYRYDGKFSSGPVPATQTTLDAYVPQGLATWANWDGSGASLLVYSAYGDAGTSALVQGVNPATGARTRPAYVPYSHVGGIAISNGYAWVAGGSKLSRYSLDALRGAFKGTSSASIRPSYTRSVYGSSFVGASSGHLFAGRFNENSRDVMHRYRIEPDGTLTQLAGSVEVPAKTQGVGVTTTHYFFSSSYGETSRSTLYVVRRGYGLDSAKAACFSAPTMSEGATVHDGRLYVIFESGARFYTSGSDPTNVIKRLHQAPLGNLTVLTP